MSKDNSGPAFPASNDANVNGTMGMTLRDYFAGQAIPAIIIATSSGGHDPSTKHGKGVEISMCLDAYAIADAMLRARQK